MMKRILPITLLVPLAIACGPKDDEVRAYIAGRYEAGDSLLMSGIPDAIGTEFRIDSIWREEDRWIMDAVDRGWNYSVSMKVEKKDGALHISDAMPAETGLVRRTDCVQDGDTFPGLMGRLGVDATCAYNLLECSRGVFDARKILSGRQVIAYCDSTGSPEYVIYCNSKVRSTVFRCCDSLAVWTFDKPTTIEHVKTDVTIRTSLWNDMLEKGASPLLIVELADIYAWTINFFGLQEGDRFRAIYDQRICEGEIVDIEEVLFCIYDSGKYSATAIRFDQHDGKDVYWNEKGESMKKAFLKAPLKYNRISSRFTYHRKHPVTGKVRPHTAVDYAAPKGTPVHSIGDGTVTLCGWDPSGGGNRIKIKHMNGYETCYMHLSKFAKGMKAGARVAQGQTIGYVGSTGRSTGPHLDFRVWKDRKPIDPLKMISPPAKPLDAANMDSLKVLVEKYRTELED